jgi:hypothetical protein
MLNELTSEQKSLIPIIRNKYIEKLKSGLEVDKEKVTNWIDYIYEKINLDKPILIFVDSPLGLQYGVNILKELLKNIDNKDFLSQVWSQVESQVRSQVWSQVRSQVWSQVWSQVGSQVGSQVVSQVRSQVWSQVWSQVGSQVGSQVVSQVGSQVVSQVRSQVGSQVWYQVESQVRSQVRLEKLKFNNFGYRGLTDYGWLSFYDYFKNIKIVDNKDCDKYYELFNTNIYDEIFLKGFCLVCSLPNYLERDENGNMHSETRSAISWKDGYELYYLHGICFEKDEWEKIVKKEISLEEILKINNQEKKSAIIRIYGYDYFLKNLKYTVLDERTILNEKGKPMNEQVIEVDLKDDNVPARFIKCECWSTEKEYMLRVDPRMEQTKTCKGALAMLAGMTEEEYKFEKET